MSSVLCTSMATMGSEQELRALIQRVTSEAPFSMRQIAEEAGISYDAIRSWATDRRTPRPQNLLQLSAVLERRGADMLQLASHLRDAALKQS